MDFCYTQTVPGFYDMFAIDASIDELVVAETLKFMFVHYGCLNRWICCSTWILFKLVFVCYGCLNRLSCCCTGIVVFYAVVICTRLVVEAAG